MRGEAHDRGVNTESSFFTRRCVLAITTFSVYGVFVAYLLRRHKKAQSDVKVDQGGMEMGVDSGKDLMKCGTEGVRGIPQSWVDRKGADVLGYAHFIQDCGFKNITPYQVIYPHMKERGEVANSLPPKDLWRNIIPTLRVLDEMSHCLNAEMKPFTSVYRSPVYNRAVGGKSGSQHLVNKAVDVQFYGVAPRDVARVAKELREEGVYSGGVGVYNTFTHIDTRGYDANW